MYNLVCSIVADTRDVRRRKSDYWLFFRPLPRACSPSAPGVGLFAGPALEVVAGRYEGVGHLRARVASVAAAAAALRGVGVAGATEAACRAGVTFAGLTWRFVEDAN